MGAGISRISKSQYLKGLHCPKRLWYYRHRPDLMPALTEQQQHVFDIGHEVGQLARDYFGNGTLIDAEYYDIDRAIHDTGSAVAGGADHIFEATAASGDGGYSKIDVLENVRGASAWDLIEVKASTGIKDYHIDDIAFQRHVFINAGYDVRRSVLMHINGNYVRRGDLNVAALFTLADGTELIRDRTAAVRERLGRFLELVNRGHEPEAGIGSHCFTPFPCDYTGHCWRDVPEFSVYDVFSRGRLEHLLSQGIVDIRDVPDGFDMTERQRIAVAACQSGRVHADISGIRDFLAALRYPLLYLDYETIFPAIPLYDNASPYQQIPFQFSLHVQEKPGGEPTHIEFLYTGKDDPRPAFVRALISNCGKSGSVVVYNQSFESRINAGLARLFPEHGDALRGINARMVDLLVPFRSRCLYHPDMLGSASIKSVLPAFVPELGYGDLAIQDGDSASRRYLACVRNRLAADEKARVFADLKEYCGLDTLAEVRLVGVLRTYATRANG